MRDRNRYTRKRYWRMRKKAVRHGRSARWWQREMARKSRQMERLALHHTSLEDDWDVWVTPHPEPWPDYPEGGWIQNYPAWRYVKDGTEKARHCPILTTEEIRRLRGKFRHAWKDNLKPWGYIPMKWTKLYVDFEALYDWMIDIACMEKWWALEYELGWNRNWFGQWGYPYVNAPAGFWYGQFTMQDKRDARHMAMPLPPPSLLRPWLKTKAVPVANAAQQLGYWFFTEDQTLSVPVEDRE